jgi:hypothetical protein
VTEVCAAAAAQARLDPAEVRRVLLDARPRNDAEFMALARRVAEVEASVADRTTTSPPETTATREWQR